MWSVEFGENIFLQSRRNDNSVGFSEYSVFASYLVSKWPVWLYECWVLLDVGKQPSLIISFNAPSLASKLLCSLIFCNILLQAEGRPRELGRSFRGWVHDSLLIMLTGHQLLQCLCLVGYTNGGIIWLQPWQLPLRTRKRSCQVFKT